jgi:hypothetical protein
MHHSLLLRRPENLSVSWANIFIETLKDEFFKKLSDVITDLKLRGTDIYSVKEAGMNSVNRHCKIIVPNEEERREKWEHSNCCRVQCYWQCVFPAMTVCKGVRINDDPMTGATKDAIFGTFPKVYINTDKQNERKYIMVQL